MAKKYQGYTLMTKTPTLLEQFRSFCFQNNASDLEKAIEYFAVFGGMGWTVDVSKPLEELIEGKVLKNYSYIHGDLTKITRSDKTHHALLSALAVGDRREHSAFKRAGLSRKEGEESIDFLIEKGVLVNERSQEPPVDEDEEVSDKALFAQPFMRFWFAAISPYYKGIKAGDYTEVKERWTHMRQEFSALVYEQLLLELVKKRLHGDPVENIGAYWDSDVTIDILTKTRSGKIVVGSGRYAKTKARKSELTKLKERCSKARLRPDIYVIFSKSGFSSELKKEKGERVMLLTLKDLKSLIEDLSEKDLLIHTNKRY